jgi:glycosyltransferase involved in cell wall biosynthesis
LVFKRAVTCKSSDLYDVSVVVPTHNRQGLLTKTLESLLDQRTGAVRYELLVVDNNSKDDTRAVVETFVRRWPHLRYFFEPRPGVSHARNTGIAAARAPIIAFIDDDVEASPTWVATIKQVFDAHPEIDCLGGRVDPRWSAPPPRWLTPRFRAVVALQTDKADTPYVDADHATPCLMTANFACRRTALEEVGGFSADYLRGEDRELQLRLWAAGKHGLYVGDVAVTTEVPPDRLTKDYHRQFYTCAGESHSRMQYLDRIDTEGRLLREIPRHTTLLGTPGFIYRSLFVHAASLIWNLATLQRSRAFFHETRLLYFASYIRTRYRQGGYSLRALPGELHRFFTSLVRSRVERFLRRHPSALPGRSVRT